MAILHQDHRDDEKKHAATTLWATLFDQQQGIIIMYHPTDRVAYTTAFVIPVVEHWMEQRKEGNVLFNDALNTFYLRLYIFP